MPNRESRLRIAMGRVIGQYSLEMGSRQPEIALQEADRTQYAAPDDDLHGVPATFGVAQEVLGDSPRRFHVAAV